MSLFGRRIEEIKSYGGGASLDTKFAIPVAALLFIAWMAYTSTDPLGVGDVKFDFSGGEDTNGGDSNGKNEEDPNEEEDPEDDDENYWDWFFNPKNPK